MSQILVSQEGEKVQASLFQLMPPSFKEESWIARQILRSLYTNRTSTDQFHRNRKVLEHCSMMSMSQRKISINWIVSELMVWSATVLTRKTKILKAKREVREEPQLEVWPMTITSCQRKEEASWEGAWGKARILSSSQIWSNRCLAQALDQVITLISFILIQTNSSSMLSEIEGHLTLRQSFKIRIKGPSQSPRTPKRKGFRSQRQGRWLSRSRN